jgi:hypothetical protein
MISGSASKLAWRGGQHGSRYQRQSRVFAVTLIALALIVASACSSSSTPAGSTAGTATTPTKLVLSSNGTPNLAGTSLSLATGSTTPGIEDTLGYIIVQTLKSWGANASLTTAESNVAGPAVVGGKLTTLNSNLATLVDLPLEVYMPNAVHLDFVFVSSKFTSLSQLKGATVAISDTTGPDYRLMPALLKLGGLSANSVHYISTGGASANASALAAHRADAAWIHVDALLSLQATGHWNILERASTMAPLLADSFWAALPSWINSHPAIVEALCLAWIHAAKVFDTSPSAWVTAAQGYTSNAQSDSEALAIHNSLATTNSWPVSLGAYTSQQIAYDYGFYKAAGVLQGPGIRPLSQVAIFSDWQAAWTIYEAHESAY